MILETVTAPTPDELTAALRDLHDARSITRIIAITPSGDALVAFVELASHGANQHVTRIRADRENYLSGELASLRREAAELRARSAARASSVLAPHIVAVPDPEAPTQKRV